MKRYVLLSGLIVFLAVAATEVRAQVTFGPQIVLWDITEIGIGARVDVELGEAIGIQEDVLQDLFASVNANYLLVSDATLLMFNANAAVPFEMDWTVIPYAGAGLNHLRESVSGVSSRWTGLNLLGGIFFDLGNYPAFAELQYSTSANGFLSLSAGVFLGN